jgi:hypothetical protein
MPTTVTRSFAPDWYVPGQPTEVSLAVACDPAATSTWFVEEDYPDGWAPSDISNGGVDNGVTIRWFSLGPASPTLTYEITPPPGTTGTHAFSGNLLGDGPAGPQTIPIGGEQNLDELVEAKHPCDANSADWTCQPAEVLAWASTWLSGGALSFLGTPLTGSGVAQAYILRASAIALANFQARYRDVGSLTSINGRGHPQRWQELPDETTTAP